MSDHLYYAQISHEDFVDAMDPVQRAFAEKVEASDPEGWDLTACVFVTATSADEAARRIEEHYGVDTVCQLAPSGFVTVRANMFEPGVALGVRGDIDARELDKCPSCHSNHVRQDATAREVECSTCGWSLEWRKP